MSTPIRSVNAAEQRRMFDSPGSFMQFTQALVMERTKTTQDIMRLAVELDIPYYWLRKFRDATIPNPSVNRVQYIYEKLTGKTLAI